jgi:uncharacterized SAM-binding protein YcdF (DUF218 family)
MFEDNYRASIGRMGHPVELCKLYRVANNPRVSAPEEFGVAPNRLFAERQSRDTFENALFSRQIANYRPGERWLLVTSAAHMPRAIAAFRAVGFSVEAYPVDYQTTGLPEDFLPSSMPSSTDTAVHEWIGLIAYRVSGRTSELFPKP